ncbi:MAG: (2Fe-2S)-binding protein [Chromatiales bacterium]|jgi:aerobic-type carbon monoxide dehydrogenase small subunit (CoxS/CutS family)
MVRLSINGTSRELDMDPSTPLLWALRDGLQLTGTKYGCGIAVCGACLVLVDGKPVHSCVTPLSAVTNKQITTIEGLSPDRSHPVQQAWIEEEVPQCGYCQSGQILAASALLQKHAKPTDADIDEAMQGVLCRCGTYPRIRKAIKRAAELAHTTDREG